MILHEEMQDCLNCVDLDSIATESSLPCDEEPCQDEAADIILLQFTFRM